MAARKRPATKAAPVRGRITSMRLIGRTGVPREYPWVQVLDNSLASVGLPAGTQVETDPYTEAAVGSMVVAHVMLEPPPRPTKTPPTGPVTVQAAVVVAFLRANEAGEAWLEDGDGNEIPTPCGAVISAVVFESRPRTDI